MSTNPVPDMAAHALLTSIANDLRTPLVSIRGALSYLQEQAAHEDDAAHPDRVARQTLIDNAAEEADRLNRFIGNLLDMARVESGALRIAVTPCDVEDVIGSTLERLDGSLKGRRVEIDLPSGLPLVPMDFSWMVKVLVHLLDNANQYSPSDSPIHIKAHNLGAHLAITVGDQGIGIPPEDLDRVFEKFYRVPHSGGESGTGLGLAICKGIIQAHGGSIRAENRCGGGTIMTIVLPL